MFSTITFGVTNVTIIDIMKISFPVLFNFLIVFSKYRDHFLEQKRNAYL